MKDIMLKIEELISQMTLDEKLGMIHGDNVYDTKGVERLGIPPIRMSDGPIGVRGDFNRETCDYIGNSNELVSSFPSSVSLAATWNEKLAKEYGKALGQEVRGRGKDISLSPGINIHRVPVGGRNFEYMSEDPHFISKMVVPLIKGLQENDIAACVKHFIANNQETNRYHVNVEMDDRALNEIYLPGFEAAIKEGNSLCLMGAYNQFRGEYCCQNSYLLKELLRDRWGFDGVIISDWNALHDTQKAIDAGIDIDMKVDSNYDEYHYANPLKRLIEAGQIKEEAVDHILRNVLKLMFKIKMFDEDRQKGSYNTAENRKAILEIARESIVLLKNEEGYLPLNEKHIKKIAVIGENANRQHAFGGGSSEVRALYEITPLLGINMYLGGNTEVFYAKGYSSQEVDEQEIQKLTEEACELAKKCDAVIYVGGINHGYDMESSDREDMKLPYGQDELIKKLLAANEKIVIVNMGGSPVEMREWVDQAPTVLQYWYSGSEGGTALAEVIFGAVNPSGKLTTTFPKRLEDSPAYHFGEFPGADNVTYNEGIFVGYRYHDTYNVEPEFCFGHGLSYTNFEYSNLRVDKVLAHDGVDVHVKVDFIVTNSGERAGKEIVQVYVADPQAKVVRPAHELKYFKKISLEPGESQEISFILTTKDFSYYSVEDANWKFEDGKFEIQIGASSRDIRLVTSI